MMKRFLSVLLTAALLVSMTALGTTAMADEVITLRLWGGVPAEAGPQACVEAFNEAFKDQGIQVEYERFVNDETGNMKLETNLLGGDDVDLYMTYTTTYLQKRATSNMALDLSELIERDGFDLVENFGEMAESFYVDGKPYSIPTKLDQYGMVLNKDLFDAAGIEIPTEWSFEEFREICKKLTHGEGADKVYGVFWNTQQDVYQILNWLTCQTLGGDPYYTPDGTATNFTDPVFEAAVSLINDTMNVDSTAITHVDSITQKLSQESVFLTGKVAMTIGPWMVRSIKDTEKYPHDFTTAFAPYPSYDGNALYSQGGYGDHLCINPNSKNIEAAWTFAKWYATEGMLPLVSGGRVPAYKGFSAETVTQAFLEGAEDHIDSATASSVLIVPKPNHAVPSITTHLPEINKVLTEEIEAIYTGRKTVEQGLTDAKTRADELLK